MSYKKLSGITGFSVSTISKAFSQSSEISESTRAKIYSAAREMGCFDKYYKEKYKKRIIAVICPELQSRYIALITELVLHELRQNGFLVLLSASDFNPEREAEFVEYYALYAKVDAIILVTPTVKKIKKYSIPVVAIGSHMENADEVYIDMERAIYDAVKLLKDNGHKRIAFIGEKLTIRKEMSFCNAAERLNISVPSQFIVRSNERFEAAGRSGADYLMSLDNAPTAIITAYDYIAIGAIHFLKSKKFKIPDDVSVIGMDDIADSQNITPTLSSIRTFAEDAVSTAVDIIIKKINNPYFKITKKTSAGAEFIQRDSVGKCINNKK